MRQIHLALAAIAASLLTCAAPERARPDIPPVTLSGGAVPRAPAADPADLDDAQIATIAESIRDGVFDRARLARRRTTDPGLRRYVFRVLATAGDPQAGVASLGMLPAGSPQEDDVARAQLARESDLADRSGYDFDRRFVSVEREAARDALERIDELLPATRDSRLRSGLQAMRATTESELRELERIERAITLAPRELPALPRR